MLGMTVNGLCQIPAWKKYLHPLQVVISGLAVCVCVFSIVVNASTVQE